MKRGGVEQWQHTLNKNGTGPKDQVLVRVTNTNWGVPGPKDQEVKMGTRRRYRWCIYTTTDNGAMGDIVRKENNRTIDRPKRDNSRTGWGSNRNNGDDNNGDAKCVRGPIGEFTRVV